ncbi:MAG: hypothetical protein ACC707_02985 [Thiohalomonadales bacterium]
MKRINLLLLIILIAACGEKNNSTAPPAPDTSGNDIVISSSTIITVSGTVQYEDITYDSNGLSTVTEFKAARRVLIELVDQNNLVIDSTSSDDGGVYNLSGSGDGLYVRILAQSGADAMRNIAIHNYLGDVYAATQNLASPDINNDVSLDINITKNSSINGAFNMLDVFLSARNFIANLSTTSLAATLVYWVDGSESYGTYYCPVGLSDAACPRGTGIYVTGGAGSSGDKDQYDDDVLWHEFSHFLEDNLGIKDSPGGPHSMTQNDLDLRLAWSEGWGNFFPTAVKSWLNSTDPGLLSVEATDLTSYVDTVGGLTNNIAGITIDLHAPGVCISQGCFIYSSNEIAVANIMSHLQHEHGIGPLWSVYQDYLTGLSDQVVNLETFWDGWLAQRLPDNPQLVALEAIYADRQVRFISDTFEASGDDASNANRLFTVCSTPSCPGEQHYFYSDILNDDIDVIGFNATAGTVYTIETFDLYNGADTEIFIQDGVGTPVLDGSGSAFSNDDRSDSTCNPVINDKLTFSSTLQFTAPSDGMYYVKIITSNTACAGSGRYGSYSLRVTAN